MNIGFPRIAMPNGKADSGRTESECWLAGWLAFLNRLFRSVDYSRGRMKKTENVISFVEFEGNKGEKAFE